MSMMMKIGSYIRSLGFGGFLCSVRAGLLFLLYPDTFPKQSTLEGIMLIGACLGAACQRLTSALIKPFLYYASLAQLTVLRRHIGERTQNEIIQSLTIKYFLGEDQRNCAHPLWADEKDALTPRSRGCENFGRDAQEGGRRD